MPTATPTPIVIVPSGGIPVVESTTGQGVAVVPSAKGIGVAVTIATNGFGIAVVGTASTPA